MSGLTARFTVRRPEGFELDIDLSIAPGTTAALLGPNGAGKSTALAVIAGLLGVDTGRVALGDVVFDDPGTGTFVSAERRGVGAVFQDYLLFPHLSVLANVAFGLRARGVTKEEANRRAMEWLDRLEIQNLAPNRPADLSGGQRQRVALARALVTEPAMLLLDEPLAALDITTRSRSRGLLAEYLSQFDGPRLLITHDPIEAFLLGDEIHIIEGGSITQSGSGDEIRLRPKTDYAAEVGGTNLLRGFAREGRVQVGGHVVNIADHAISGETLLSFHPSAVAVHRSRPDGSPRNTWATEISRVERFGDRARLLAETPLPLTIEVTGEAVDALEIREGSPVWVSVKATEIRAEPVS